MHVEGPMCLRCSQVKQSVLSKELVGTILREYKIMHAEVILKEDCSEDDFIDVLEGMCANVTYYTYIAQIHGRRA